MAQLKERIQIELDQHQAAAILKYAEEHRMKPDDVLRRALEMYFLAPRTIPEVAKVEAPSPEASVPVPVSRHTGRDYSSFGSMHGKFPDGVAFQNTIRDER